MRSILACFEALNLLRAYFLYVTADTTNNIASYLYFNTSPPLSLSLSLSLSGSPFLSLREEEAIPLKTAKSRFSNEKKRNPRSVDGVNRRALGRTYFCCRRGRGSA